MYSTLKTLLYLIACMSNMEILYAQVSRQDSHLRRAWLSNSYPKLQVPLRLQFSHQKLHGQLTALPISVQKRYGMIYSYQWLLSIPPEVKKSTINAAVSGIMHSQSEVGLFSREIQAFNDLMHRVAALEDYEQRIQSYGELLEQHIASASGQPVDVSTWFYFLSFDVMGDFAFAKSFKMLEDKDWHYAVVMLRRALIMLGPLSSVPWLVQLAFTFPMIPVVRDWNKMIFWCAERMGERINVSSRHQYPSRFLVIEAHTTFDSRLKSTSRTYVIPFSIYSH